MKMFSILKNTKLVFAQAFEALLESNSFERITVDDIASYCGAHRTTFYYHFKDKSDLVSWYFDYLMTDYLVSRLDEHDKKQIVNNWSECLFLMFQIMREKKSFFTAVIKYTGQNSFEEYLYKWNVKSWDEHICDFHSINEFPVELQYAREFHYSGFTGIVIKWIRKGMREKPEQMVKIVVDNMSPLMREYLP